VEDAMVEIIEILREEHRNIEKLLRVMEEELSVFDRGERPDYEVFGAIIEFFKSIQTPVIILRRTSFTRNLRRAILIAQRQLQTFKLSIEKVQSGCAASLKLSTLFSTIRKFFVKVSIGLFVTSSRTKEDISL